MNYEEKLREIINSNSEYYPSEDKVLFAKYFPELKESEDERIRKDIISYLRNEKIVKRYISDIEVDKWIAWLEKQGEKRPTEDAKKLDADKVIAWLVANILDYEYFVEWFKKDFGL